ncbi:unnamed protein product [Linum trigynum]|uniref:Uncharacterized protein n=1 Tax=Linum trigynum TaxID=586398 RepID=A0AAV2ERP5_9ROSI
MREMQQGSQHISSNRHTEIVDGGGEIRRITSRTALHTRVEHSHSFKALIKESILKQRTPLKVIDISINPQSVPIEGGRRDEEIRDLLEQKLRDFRQSLKKERRHYFAELESHERQRESARVEIRLMPTTRVSGASRGFRMRGLNRQESHERLGDGQESELGLSPQGLVRGLENEGRGHTLNVFKKA